MDSISTESSSGVELIVCQTELDGCINHFVHAWMKHLLSLDPTSYIKEVKCRVLALNGSRDLQVNAASNLAAIEAGLKAGGNKHSLIRKYDGLNHLFQHATTGLPAEYGQIEETIAPAVLEDIKAWIQK